MKLSAGILAGGKSSRMGQNKALLTIDNERFLNRIAGELGAFDEVLLSVAKKGDYAEYNFDRYADEHENIGPIEGIYQIVKHARNEYVFVCAVDMPFITADLVKYMAEFISSDYDCYVMMDEDHVHPLCAIYSKAMLPVIEELIANGHRRLMDILNLVRTKYIKLENSCFDKKVVRNINTKEEYVRVTLPKVFCVSAVKNSGKTGLIVKLINEFICAGYTVGVVKHDGHDYTMDYEDTDTYRFTQAGAKVSSIYSKSQCSVNISEPKSLEEMIAFAKSECEIVIVEGAKDSIYPKIEVVRKEISDSIVCNESHLICVATDVVSQDSVSCPVYGLDDIEGIFLCLKKYLGLEFLDEVN